MKKGRRGAEEGGDRVGAAVCMGPLEGFLTLDGRGTKRGWRDGGMEERGTDGCEKRVIG